MYNVKNDERDLAEGQKQECSVPDESDTADRFYSLAYKIYALVTRNSNACPTQKVM